MAHFAKINKDKKVEQVIVISNDDISNLEFPKSEPLGQDFIKNKLKIDGKWLQTSYNGNFRGQYAGIGMSYNEQEDVFEDQIED